MNNTVAILFPGDMGHQIARVLIDDNHRGTDSIEEILRLSKYSVGD